MQMNLDMYGRMHKVLLLDDMSHNLKYPTSSNWYCTPSILNTSL